MKILKLSLALVAAAFLLTATGCQDEGCTDPFAVNYDMDAKEGGECTYPELTLAIKHKVGDTELVYGDIYSINGYDIKFNLSQFYMSNFRIMDMDGNGYEITENDETIHRLAKLEETNYDLGTIRAGHAHMLMFDIGVTEAVNAQDEVDFAAWPPTHPLAAQSPAMHWNWNSGYVFIKVEGMVDVNKDGQFDADETITYHIGLDKNRTGISLMTHGDITETKEEFAISFDLETLLADFDWTQKANRTSHSMPATEAVTEQFKTNLANAFSIGH